MRICHYIKPNARSETPTRAIWLQAWTFPLKKTLRETTFGAEFFRLCRGTKDTNTGVWSYVWITAHTNKELWKTLDNWTCSKTKTYLMIDQPSLQLPLMQAFSIPMTLGWKLTLAVLPPAPTILRYRKGTKSLLVLATSNIWQVPFADCWTGKTTCMHLRLNEEDAPCEHVKKLNEKLEAIRELTVAWWSFLKNNDLGGFSPTSGSQSKRVWRHKFMTHKVLIDCHDEALALCREAVYGARTQVFRRGTYDGPIYELDTNGSYGGIMRDMRVPVKLRGLRRQVSIRDMCEFVRDNVCVAKVDIDSETNLYPVRRDGRLSFSAGRFQTVLAGEEFEYALDHGDIARVLECAVYECAQAFSAYMQALWSMRKLAESMALLQDASGYKLLMASFFGVWAQHGRVWEKCGDAQELTIRSWTDINADTKQVTEYRQFGGIVQKLNDETEARESSPAIAACILAGARCQLERYVRKAGVENVYYVDTDSVFTNQVGFERLSNDIREHELGKLKVKHVYNRVTFHQSKHITGDGKIRHAGVSTSAVYVAKGIVEQSQNQHVSTGITARCEVRASTRQVRKVYKEE